jgi:hypothetical protein
LGRRRARSGALAASALALAGLAFAAEPSRLREERWLAARADRAAALTREPAECLALPRDPAARQSVEIGRAAFRSPLLLGGQAARAGLACESCHRGGRGNPDFHLPGLSGEPGTADVTSSLLSSHRFNGVDDPRPIPDLAGPRTALSQVGDADRLRRFIHGLIVEEFDGPEPPPAVLDGLTAYVQALSPEACPARATRAVTVVARLDDARRAVAAASRAAGADRATALVLLNAARAELGRIAERYPGPELTAARARLRAADLELAAALTAIRDGEPAETRLAAWLARSQEWGATLASDEPRSLFNPERLAEAKR